MRVYKAVKCSLQVIDLANFSVLYLWHTCGFHLVIAHASLAEASSLPDWANQKYVTMTPSTIDSELQCQTASADFIIIGFYGLPSHYGRKSKDVFASKGVNPNPVQSTVWSRGSERGTATSLRAGHSTSAPAGVPRTYRCSSPLASEDFIHEGCRGGVVARLLSYRRARFQSGSLPDFRTWQTCRTIPLASGFSRGSPVPPLNSSATPYSPHFTLIGSQDPVVKIRPNLCNPLSLFIKISRMSAVANRTGLNFTLPSVLEPRSLFHWLLNTHQSTTFLTELHVIGALKCGVFIYWSRVTQDVPDTLCSNDKPGEPICAALSRQLTRLVLYRAATYKCSEGCRGFRSEGRQLVSAACAPCVVLHTGKGGVENPRREVKKENEFCLWRQPMNKVDSTDVGTHWLFAVTVEGDCRASGQYQVPRGLMAKKRAKDKDRGVTREVKGEPRDSKWGCSGLADRTISSGAAVAEWIERFQTTNQQSNEWRQKCPARARERERERERRERERERERERGWQAGLLNCMPQQRTEMKRRCGFSDAGVPILYLVEPGSGNGALCLIDHCVTRKFPYWLGCQLATKYGYLAPHRRPDGLSVRRGTFCYTRPRCAPPVKTISVKEATGEFEERQKPWVQQTSGHCNTLQADPASSAQREPIAMRYIDPHTGEWEGGDEWTGLRGRSSAQSAIVKGRGQLLDLVRRRPTSGRRGQSVRQGENLTLESLGSHVVCMRFSIASRYVCIVRRGQSFNRNVDAVSEPKSCFIVDTHELEVNTLPLVTLRRVHWLPEFHFFELGGGGGNRYGGHSARLAHRCDEALGVRVSVARIAPSLLDLGRAATWSPTRSLFSAFQAEKRRSDKGDINTRIKCAIAAKRKALS
ncbi:hypothetical protein PR048_007068 [Dryococelus australis]|uniref:Uncharacterized protein n=1 Tax=Dryococelus australis TaxID=614101 RepID=A0ABQ9ICN8_9NEOP|nr:hypothetical protein PR048_007068 [Dryococelus australis]